MKRRIWQAVGGWALAIGSAAGMARADAGVRLQGAGATFPAPLYKRWVAEYQRQHPDVAIDYQSVGSGGGIKNFTDKTVDFAATDAAMSKKELAAAGGADRVTEFPAVAGAVVPAYNLPGVANLQFTGVVLAQIYLGQITAWNDPALVKINPGANLPATAITPVYRTDGSGTTNIWTSYLSTQSEAFKAGVGMGKSVQFPAGQGGKGNEGVTAVVQQTPGAIGYVEENYADQNHLAYGSVQNAAGRFVKASPDAVSAAAAGAADKLQGHQLRANIWNQPGEQAYPISSLTYLLVYSDLDNLRSKPAAQALVDFLWWATHDGQKFAPGLDYAPLPDAVRTKVEAVLGQLSYHGEPIKPAGM